ncbi:hypothetical protein PWT90_03415 [Aphanocladium album]|nr:hypothetical protein PWT90_03415 [Aphanocladium album]
MKLLAILLFTAALGVLAAPAPRPWCMQPSQPCWKIKRAVEALDEHTTSKAVVIQPAAGREAALAQATANINIFANAAFEHLAQLAAQAQAQTQTSSQPESFVEQHITQNGKRSAPLWCIEKGEDALCWKRAVEQTSEIDKRWCLRPSQPCWKVKRAAESVLSARDEDNGAEAQEECAAGDAACLNAKRHLDDLHAVARTIIETF